jgi:3-mercaptopyruvate sulfurtransferase SseA
LLTNDSRSGRSFCLPHESSWLCSPASGAFENFAGWAAIFGSLGVSNRSEVIVYDDGEMKFAARLRFPLFYYGVRTADPVEAIRPCP